MDMLLKLCVICPLVFFSGFVDSIAGGGGIISLPAYHIVGLAPVIALGTNKFASSSGTLLSTFRFIKNKKIHIGAAAVSVPLALTGSGLGAALARRMSDVFLRYILLIALPILAVFILTNKKTVSESARKKLSRSAVLIVSAIAGFTLGVYDGFFGPGTGTFLILIFHTVVGFDILTASGNAKAINLASNLAAAFVFFIGGEIMLQIAIPAAICSIAGNYVGSGISLKNGAKAIRPAFIGVLALLIIKILYDLIF